MRTIVLTSCALLASLAWLPAACSSDPVQGTEHGPLDGGADVVSPPNDAQPDVAIPDAQPCVPGAVWKGTSAKIGLTSFGFWEGSTGYEKSREDLTPAQATALDKLCVIPPPTQTGADYTSYRITITDKDGTATEYRAAQDNVHDSDEGPVVTPTIDIATLRPFLQTIHCLSASETREFPGDSNADAGADGGDAGPTQPWSKAATMTDDTACINGIFAPSACHDIWLKLAIATPGDYELDSLSCFESLRIRVLTADGATELAASPVGTAGACPKVPVHFDAAGTYPVVLEKRNVAGCTQNGTGGDFALRIARTH